MLNTKSITFIVNLFAGAVAALGVASFAGWTAGIAVLLPAGLAIGFLFCFPTGWIWERFVYGNGGSFAVSMVSFLLLPALTALVTVFAATGIVQVFG